MITPIKHINAIKIVREIKTEGSAPLFIMADDTDEYIAKTSKPPSPYVELINEVLCGYFLKCWGLEVPPFAIAHIGYDLVEAFELEGDTLSNKYSERMFEIPFFASKVLSPVDNLEKFIGAKDLKSSQFEHFKSPLDFIKIGLFDIWVCNKDRKPENPNILLLGNASELSFCPIDHTAAFGYCTNYTNLKDAHLHMENNFRILTSALTKSIVNFASQTADFKESLETQIKEGMEIAVSNIDAIAAQVPTEWGFSKKAKEHLKKILSNEARNKTISKEYLRHLK